MSAPDPAAPAGFKPKKSVALSGVPAGNTALCTVGRSGNDLHYRGYDILEVAESCEFEEIAYLLIHGKLPNKTELAAYKLKLKGLRGIPAPVRAVLEQLPPATHPMDVMRTGASALGCVLPEGNDHDAAGAREIADHLVASFGSMLCYWYHFSHSSRRIHVETEDDSVGGHFLHLLLRGVEQLREFGLVHLRVVAMTLHRKAKIQPDPYQRDDERIDELIEQLTVGWKSSIESPEYRCYRCVVFHQRQHDGDGVERGGQQRNGDQHPD